MCNKNIDRIHGFNMFAAGGDPLMGGLAAWGVGEIYDNTSKETRDEWIGRYADLHFIGGGLIRDAHGVTRRDEKRAAAEVERQERYLKQQYDPLPPEKSLMQIDDAAEVRDRRRRAVLLGIDQLKTGSGHGVATGGNYSGASAGMY